MYDRKAQQKYYRSPKGKAKRKAYYESHKAEAAENARNRKLAFPEKVAEIQHNSYVKHKDAITERHRVYYRMNPERWRAFESRRRTRVAVDMTAEDREISVVYRKVIASDPCFYCGAPGEHDDHYQSLATGGTDHWWNLVRACAPCNLSKHTMDGDTFIEYLVGQLIKRDKYRG
jgi:5-methylcytosine-specific restriction endonuclease McrA